MPKFSHDELKRLLANREAAAKTSPAVTDEGPSNHAAPLVAYLLTHAQTLSEITEAFMDVMDGVKEHEIRGMTGLVDHRCKEIYKLASDLLNS